MCRNLIFIVFSLFLLPVIPSYGQKVEPDHFHDSNGNTYHQLFLDFHATELMDVRYSSDDLRIEGNLSVDGYSVIIKNYAGDKSVKVKVKDDKDSEREVTKSRCFIDPVLLEL
jgi:hypothetical protein